MGPDHLLQMDAGGVINQLLVLLGICVSLVWSPIDIGATHTSLAPDRRFAYATAVAVEKNTVLLDSKGGVIVNPISLEAAINAEVPAGVLIDELDVVCPQRTNTVALARAPDYNVRGVRARDGSDAGSRHQPPVVRAQVRSHRQLAHIVILVVRLRPDDEYLWTGPTKSTSLVPYAVRLCPVSDRILVRWINAHVVLRIPRRKRIRGRGRSNLQ